MPGCTPQLLTDFNLELDAWLRDGRAREYFAKRDQKALPVLGRVLMQLPAPKPPKSLPDG